MKGPRFAESSDQYPFVIAELADSWRVIECADDMQWILQRRTTNRGEIQWNGRSFCRTKEALLRCIKEREAGKVPGTLLALPDRYLEGARQPQRAMDSKFQQSVAPPHSEPQNEATKPPMPDLLSTRPAASALGATGP
jgi:hypothetical protein